MSKKDYISDNLITMRDRLRESTAAIRDAAEQKKRNSLPLEESTAVQTAETPVPAAPESAADRRMTEGIRAKQDLAGRLARDLARISSLLAEQESRVRSLHQVRESLQMLETNLDKVTPAGSAGLFAAEIDRLRLEYFRQCGQLDTLTASAAVPASNHYQDEIRKENSTLQGAWIIAGAIIAGTALIAAATAMIFL